MTRTNNTCEILGEKIEEGKCEARHKEKVKQKDEKDDRHEKIMKKLLKHLKIKNMTKLVIYYNSSQQIIIQKVKK